MQHWLRFVQEGKIGFGQLAQDTVHVYVG
ncbi:MAG: Rv2993c-like domain-containing protein, partial [Hylemonella sp.]